MGDPREDGKIIQCDSDYVLRCDKNNQEQKQRDTGNGMKKG